MTLEEWIDYGIKNGWCTAPICYTHEGLPVNEREEKDFEEGFDPCVVIMRMTENADEQKEIENYSEWVAAARHQRGL